MKTFHHSDFGNLDALLREKRRSEDRISVCVPTLNEEKTIGEIVRCIREELMEGCDLIDELVVMDSGSTDQTREVAAEAGAIVHLAEDILPHKGSGRGKGENLWKAVYECSGDILCFIDGDISNFDPHFVLGTVGPLLIDADISYVKGYYKRPLHVPEGIDPEGGGRVTEILVRPLLKRFFPELVKLKQPLAGEYAARRSILDRIPFPMGYGVETAHLIDVFRELGSEAIAQTDLEERIHRNRSLADLGNMSGQILDAFFARQPGGQSLSGERPPMVSIPEYLDRFPARKRFARMTA